MRKTIAELKKTVLLALPLIATLLLGQTLPFIDTVMAGRHSPEVLASVALGAQLFTLVLLFMLGIAITITTNIARYHGADDRLRIRRSFQQGLWLTLFLGLAAIVLTALTAYVPHLIGSAPEIADGARRYLLTLAPGSGVAVLALAARYFLEGMSYPRTGVVVQLLLIPLNITGNYLFLNGFWIVPPLGAQGMALATTLCFLVYALLMFAALWRNPRWTGLRLFSHFPAPDFGEMKDMLRIGLPIALGMMMEAGLFLAVSLLVSRSDAVFASANQIALNYAGISFMMPLGLANALTVRSGNALGSGDRAALRRRALGGLWFSALFMLLASSFIFLFSKQIVSLYTDHAGIRPIAVNILFLIGIFQLVDGIQVCATGILRGLHDTKIPMLYALICYWVIGFPTGLLLAYVAGFGIYGLWGGIVAGLAVNAVLGVRRVLKMTRLPHRGGGC